MIRKVDLREGENRLGDPICLRDGGLAVPAGTDMCPDAKKEHSTPPEDQQIGPKHEKQEKTCLENVQRDPALKKSAQTLREAAKHERTS